MFYRNIATPFLVQPHPWLNITPFKDISNSFAERLCVSVYFLNSSTGDFQSLLDHKNQEFYRTKNRPE